MGEPYGIPDERRKAIETATVKHADIKAELEKMRHLTRLSARFGFETCRMAFVKRATWLEGQEQRALDEIVKLCTGGSMEASGIFRKALGEITAGAEQ